MDFFSLIIVKGYTPIYCVMWFNITCRETFSFLKVFYTFSKVNQSKQNPKHI